MLLCENGVMSCVVYVNGKMSCGEQSDDPTYSQSKLDFTVSTRCFNAVSPSSNPARLLDYSSEVWT